MTVNNSKCRIVFLITNLHTGGAEMMLYKLLSQMDRHEFAPEVISLMEVGAVGEKIRELGIPVHAIDMKKTTSDPVSGLRLVRLVKSLQPDLLQGWMYHGNLAAQFANSFLPHAGPVLWSIRHGIDGLKNEKRTTAWVITLGAKLSKKPMTIIYNSKVSAQQHEALGYMASKSLVIPNGFDTDSFSPSREGKQWLRQELGLCESSRLIGLFGRYHAHKDHDTFIRAAACIAKTRDDVHFVLAGSEVDADNPKLVRTIEELNLKSRVHLLGVRKDLNRIMPGLDLVCSSSIEEGFSNVLGEAMACGVPCVATDVGENGFVIGDTGILVPPRQPESMAKAWSRMFEKSSEERRRLGERARERIVRDFSLPSVTSNYESVYHKVLTSHCV